jgi:hypothetical protein
LPYPTALKTPRTSTCSRPEPTVSSVSFFSSFNRLRARKRRKSRTSPTGEPGSLPDTPATSTADRVEANRIKTEVFRIISV